jgi:ribosome modulation factor
MARRLKAPANGSGAEKKSRQKSDAPKPNLTDETIAEYFNKLVAAKKEHEDALKAAKEKNGIYRSILKDFKKVGGDTDVMVWRINQRNRTPEEIDRETRLRNHYAKATNLPLGSQLGMDDLLGVSVATAIENAAKSDTDEVARNLGAKAGKAGKPQSTSPYAEGTPQHEAWLDGWAEEQKRLALSIGRGKSSGEGAPAH